MPISYHLKVAAINKSNLASARLIAVKTNQLKRSKLLESFDVSNIEVSKNIKDRNTAKIALAMLCLGEASKSSSGTSFYFGNSSPTVINIFLNLLKLSYSFDPLKVRCTVQCRADQDTGSLEEFWSTTTGIPMKFFYKARIDPRTVGKPTLKTDYKGVLRIDYFDNYVRLDLESLAKSINSYLSIGPVA